MEWRGLGWAGGGHSRSLEEEDPPVSGAQVEDVGPLAVVTGTRGQCVVDADGVLQLSLRRGLPRLVYSSCGVPISSWLQSQPSSTRPYSLP